MTYIALLKGINVGGNHLIKMDALKKLFEEMGYKNIRTLLQSGNVKFDAPHGKADVIRKKIEKYLEKSLGYYVAVVIRTIEEIEKFIADYPYSKIKDHDSYKIYVSFLDGKPGNAETKELESLCNKNEMFSVSGINVYQLCRGGFADSLMAKNIVEKKLKVKATTRNWATVNKLLSFK